MREITSLGAAIAVGLGAGVYKNLEEVQQILAGSGNSDRDGKDPVKTRFEPRLRREEVEQGWQRWERAVEMARGWVVGDEESSKEGDCKEGEGEGNDKEKTDGGGTVNRA